jgi:hypothetical protein
MVIMERCEDDPYSYFTFGLEIHAIAPLVPWVTVHTWFGNLRAVTSVWLWLKANPTRDEGDDE